MALEEYVFIPVKGGKTISGIVSVPFRFIPQRRPGFILAHGRENDMFHPLIASLANALADAGYITLRFNFLFRDEGREGPESDGALGAAWVQVYQFLKSHPLYKPSAIVIGGKSLGCRIASQVAADNLVQAAGLIFLGYPLHPSARPQEFRDSHLYRIKAPMLLIAGSRDPLCDAGKLGEVMAKIGPAGTLEMIEGGDHSFNLPESSGITEQEVHARIIDKTLSWVKTNVKPAGDLPAQG